MKGILKPGVEVRCLHCGKWHVVRHDDNVSSTPYANEMLYFECRGARYYAGQVDTTSLHHETRGAHKFTGLGCPKCREPIADIEGELVGSMVFACPCGHRCHGHPARTVVQ